MFVNKKTRRKVLGIRFKVQGVRFKVYGMTSGGKGILRLSYGEGKVLKQSVEDIKSMLVSLED